MTLIGESQSQAAKARVEKDYKVVQRYLRRQASVKTGQIMITIPAQAKPIFQLVIGTAKGKTGDYADRIDRNEPTTLDIAHKNEDTNQYFKADLLGVESRYKSPGTI